MPASVLSVAFVVQGFSWFLGQGQDDSVSEVFADKSVLAFAEQASAFPVVAVQALALFVLPVPVQA